MDLLHSSDRIQRSRVIFERPKGDVTSSFPLTPRSRANSKFVVIDDAESAWHLLQTVWNGGVDGTIEYDSGIPRPIIIAKPIDQEQKLAMGRWLSTRYDEERSARAKGHFCLAFDTPKYHGLARRTNKPLTSFAARLLLVCFSFVGSIHSVGVAVTV